MAALDSRQAVAGAAGERRAEGRAPRVLLAVCGGIAAYKACEVLRGLQKAGCDVRVTMTADAERFVGAVTFEALSGHPVATDLYDYAESPIPHIVLAEDSDLAVVVPATANVMAKMAAGLADDCLTTTLLACACPVLVAPGMNVHMWQNPATQANVETLRSRGVRFVGPDEGRLACGDVGQGKLASVEDIVAAALALLPGAGDAATRDLLGTRLVVTAGPTHEAVDPVRYLANRATGKMGFALAAAAAARGAEVTLVAGPVSDALATPAGVRRVDVVSAAEMYAATCAAFEDADAAVLNAAVADYTPAHPADHKLKKSRERLDTLELVESADILADLSAAKGDRVVVGFAAETDDVVTHAQAKLERKGCDLIVAHDVSAARSTFGADTDHVLFVDADGVEESETLPLTQVADLVLDHVRDLLATRRGSGTTGEVRA